MNNQTCSCGVTATIHCPIHGDEVADASTPAPATSEGQEAQELLDDLKAKMSEVFDRLDLSIDEFTRIAVLCAGQDGEPFNEIRGICNRARKDIPQKVPVIQQRDTLERELTAATRRAEEAERERDEYLEKLNLAYKKAARLDREIGLLAADADGLACDLNLNKDEE